MSRDDIDLSKVYINKLKMHVKMVERELDNIRELIHSFEEGVLDEEDKYWDKVFQDYQQKKWPIPV